MFHLIHERVVLDLAADRVRHADVERRRREAIHRRQVARVRTSIERIPTRPELAREA
jgi:hypothetical protein